MRDQRSNTHLQVPHTDNDQLLGLLLAMASVRPDFVVHTGSMPPFKTIDFEITPAGAAFMAQAVNAAMAEEMARQDAVV